MCITNVAGEIQVASLVRINMNAHALHAGLLIYDRTLHINITKYQVIPFRTSAGQPSNFF